MGVSLLELQIKVPLSYGKSEESRYIQIYILAVYTDAYSYELLYAKVAAQTAAQRRIPRRVVDRFRILWEGGQTGQ